VATQFLAPGPLTWVQTLDGVTTWTTLKEQMINYYQPLHEELSARDSLHSLRQRGTVDEYSKAFNELKSIQFIYALRFSGILIKFRSFWHFFNYK
jgi:hypothetical protein